MDDLSDSKSKMIQLQSKCPTDADMKAGELSCWQSPVTLFSFLFALNAPTIIFLKALNALCVACSKNSTWLI